MKSQTKLENAIPQAICALRDQLDWSQAELAAHLHVSVTAVSRWETGNRVPDKWTLIPMLLIAPGPLQSVFEGIVGRTREMILDDLGIHQQAQAAAPDPYDTLRDDLETVIHSGQSQLIGQVEEMLNRLAWKAKHMRPGRLARHGKSKRRA